jgi:hypothetical protein
LICPLPLILQACPGFCSICCLFFEAPLSLICTLFCCLNMEIGSCCFALTGKFWSCEIGGLVGMCTERLGICCMQAGW